MIKIVLPMKQNFEFLRYICYTKSNKFEGLGAMKKYLKTMLAVGLASLLSIVAGCGTVDNPTVNNVDISLDTETDLDINDKSDFAHLTTPYVGEAHAVYNIVNALPLPDDDWTVRSIQIGENHGDFAQSYSPYTLTVFYEPRQGAVISGTNDDLDIPTDAFVANSNLLFDLIENLQAVTFSVRLNPAADDYVDHFDYRWSRNRHGEYSLQMTHDASTIEFAASPDSSLVWIVPPILEHDRIHLCNAGTFIDSSRRRIEPTTGLLIDAYCDGHGGPAPDFVYDRERGLFGQTRYNDAYHGGVGMHPLSDFAEIVSSWTLQNSSGLIAVEAVDSSLREVSGEGIWEEWWLADDAFSGQFALMHNRQFITDFIFDDAAHWWHMYRFATDPTNGQFTVLDMDYIAVSKDRKWGLIDKEGNIALDFIFDNIVMIDKNTAFASYNGNYGILDITATLSPVASADNATQEAGLVMVSGTITELGPFVEWSGETIADTGSGFYIQIDFVERYCQLVGDTYVTSGTPKQISLFVDDVKTAVFTHSLLEVGMVVIAHYETPTLASTLTDTAIAIVPLDYDWVYVGRFDENFLSLDGSFSLAILDDVEITYQDGAPFGVELSELANRTLAVYVATSASPMSDEPLVHGIASSRIIVLFE